MDSEKPAVAKKSRKRVMKPMISVMGVKMVNNEYLKKAFRAKWDLQITHKMRELGVKGIKISYFIYYPYEQIKQRLKFYGEKI